MLILFVSLIFLTIRIYPQKRIILTDSVSDYSIDTCSYILFDSSRKLKIQDVAYGSEANNFRRIKKVGDNLGYREEAVWIRFTVRNNSEENRNWFLNLNYGAIDNVEFFKSKDGKKFIIEKAGLKYPMEGREIKNHIIVFPFSLKDKEWRTFFLRIESGKSIPVYMTIDSPEEFFKNEQSKHLILGILYGAIIILAIYNLFLFFSVKDLSYLLYFFYAISICYYQTAVDGLGYQFLTPNLPDYNLLYGIVSTYMLIVFGSLFTKEFLQVKKYSGLLNKLFIALIGTVIFCIVYTLIDRITDSILTPYVGFIYLLLLLTTCIYCLFKGNKNASYYLWASGLFIVGVFFRASKNLGILDVSFLTQYGVLGGLLGEMTVLSFALGNRINTIKQEEEKEKALIRSRIASDLHDEIGGNLSSISLSSQMVAKSASLKAEGKKRLDDITLTAKETADSIRDIIWFINPMHDEDAELINKMRDTASEILGEINYTFSINKKVKFGIKNLQIRRNLFLVYKYILNNIINTASVNKVEIKLLRMHQNYRLAISCYGERINFEDEKYADCLINVERRVKQIRGQLELSSNEHGGTNISIVLKDLD